MRFFAPYLYVIALYSAFAASILLAGEQRRIKAEPPGSPPPRLPRITLVLFLIVAVPTVLQFFFPTLLTALERDHSLILAGEFWRLATSLLVQDGGIQGSIFNLVSLLLLGSIAERFWGRRLLALFFLCGITAQIPALFWQPIGAGNSVANFGIAASLAVWCLLQSRHIAIRLLTSLSLATGLLLLFFKDIHGVAMAIGILCGLYLRWRERVISVKSRPMP